MKPPPNNNSKEQTMLFLHTSDWHLGCEMEGRSRHEEAEALLNHMIACVKKYNVHTLLVAGDIFDSHTPSNHSTKQYYDFLRRLKAETSIENVVIIAGNHDSPTYLEAPASILELLNVHVIGRVEEDDLEREVIPLKESGEIRAVVCAVPYLVSPGSSQKSPEEQDTAYERYVVEHYAKVVELAASKYPAVPIVAMGHFFAVGGRVSDDTTLRGTLHSIHMEKLPWDKISYFALGHLHQPQKVSNLEKVRYSGSLMKMSFAEFKKGREFVLWDSEKPEEVQCLPIPPEEVPEQCEMAVLEGTVNELETGLLELDRQRPKGATKRLWVSVQNTGLFYPDLKNHLTMLLEEDSSLDIVFCKNQLPNPNVQIPTQGKVLAEMTPESLFKEFLDHAAQPSTEGGEPLIPQEEKDWYVARFREALEASETEDVNKA